MTAALVAKLGVGLLDMRGVGKHYGAQITRRSRRPDRFGVALRDQVRKTPRVIDVSMRQNNRIEILDLQREFTVLLR